MKFNSISEIREHFNEFEYAEEVHEAINFLLDKINDVKPNQFVGRIITDFFCNGFFGRRYDLHGSVIVDSGLDYITIRDTKSNVATAYFEEGWQRKEMAELVDSWTR